MRSIMEQADGKHPCPVCGRTVFSEAFEICPICGWENSGDESIPEMAGGANGLSFNDYCMEYRRKIAADPAYTWVKECDEQSEKKGIFWIVDRKNLQNNEPYLFRIPVDPVGVPSFLTPIPPFNSKYGDNYNHKQTWETYVPAELRRGKPYNYYPRGRVEIKEKGKAKIFLNPDIAMDEIIAYIAEKFRLQHREVKVIADGSRHYSYSAEEER